MAVEVAVITLVTALMAPAAADNIVGGLRIGLAMPVLLWTSLVVRSVRSRLPPSTKNIALGVLLTVAAVELTMAAHIPP